MHLTEDIQDIINVLAHVDGFLIEKVDQLGGPEDAENYRKRIRVVEDAWDGALNEEGIASSAEVNAAVVLATTMIAHTILESIGGPEGLTGDSTLCLAAIQELTKAAAKGYVMATSGERLDADLERFLAMSDQMQAHPFVTGSDGVTEAPAEKEVEEDL